MINKVFKAVRSFADYVEGLKSCKHPLLKRNIKAMREALEVDKGKEGQSEELGGEDEMLDSSTFFYHPGKRKSYGIYQGRDEK